MFGVFPAALLRSFTDLQLNPSVRDQTQSPATDESVFVSMLAMDARSLAHLHFAGRGDQLEQR